MKPREPHGTPQLTLLLLVGLPLGAAAQSQPIPHRIEPYAWMSGAYGGDQGAAAETVLALRHPVSVPGAAWLRLHFRQGALGAASFVTLTSLQDGARQHLDGVALRQWRNTSAYFNGDAVEVALYVAPEN